MWLFWYGKDFGKKLLDFFSTWLSFFIIFVKFCQAELNLRLFCNSLSSIPGIYSTVAIFLIRNPLITQILTMTPIIRINKIITITQIVTLTQIITTFLASRKCDYYEWLQYKVYSFWLKRRTKFILRLRKFKNFFFSFF